MLITCKACAAVNFIQSSRVKRGEAHCTICRKRIDISATADADQPAAYCSNPPPAPPLAHDLLADSFGRARDPLLLGELERTIQKMNSKQRLAISAPTYSREADVADVIIEDEEEEDLDMSPSIKLPTLDLARWNAATAPSVPATSARARLNQRLTVAAWMFVVGLGTAGVAGAAVAHTNATAQSDKKNATKSPAPTATALLTQHAEERPTPKSR